jgi:LAS superfamily LD-carboxypeptidase LdcB|tara:strand:- start:385 stop:690 length:306 start_codon:yes stop_codon:yes gene_type:complete
MKKIYSIMILFISILILSGCQTVKNKTNAIVEKENEKLSKYIGKSSKVLRLDLGKPDQDYKNEKGNLELVYKTKKYGIPCDRRFELNNDSVVIGFISNGCF